MKKKIADHLGDIFCYTLILILVVIAVIVIWGGVENSKNKISEGTVVDKYSYIQAKPVYRRWYHIKISGDKNGKTVEYDMTVTKSEYEKYEVGDHYPKD